MEILIFIFNLISALSIIIGIFLSILLISNLFNKPRKFQYNYKEIFHWTKKAKNSRVVIHEWERWTSCRTDNWERVRSKWEKFIADLLNFYKIDYVYEPSITLWNNINIKPDFYLPEQNIYIEYFWLLWDKKYNYNIHLKRKTYKKYNLECIYLYPKNLKDFKHLKNSINAIYKTKINDWLFKDDVVLKYKNIVNNISKELYEVISSGLIDFRKNIIISSNYNIQAHEVFQNKAIRYLAYYLPQTKEELTKIEWLTRNNIEKYWDDILTIIREKQKHISYFAQDTLCKDK